MVKSPKLEVKEVTASLKTSCFEMSSTEVLRLRFARHCSKGNKRLESTCISAPDASTFVGITAKNGFLEFTFETFTRVSPSVTSGCMHCQRRVDGTSIFRCKCHSCIWEVCDHIRFDAGFQKWWCCRRGSGHHIADYKQWIFAAAPKCALAWLLREAHSLRPNGAVWPPGDKHYTAHESEHRKAFQDTPLIPFPMHQRGTLCINYIQVWCGHAFTTWFSRSFCPWLDQSKVLQMLRSKCLRGNQRSQDLSDLSFNQLPTVGYFNFHTLAYWMAGSSCCATKWLAQLCRRVVFIRARTNQLPTVVYGFGTWCY